MSLAVRTILICVMLLGVLLHADLAEGAVVSPDAPTSEITEVIAAHHHDGFESFGEIEESSGESDEALCNERQLPPHLCGVYRLLPDAASRAQSAPAQAPPPPNTI